MENNTLCNRHSLGVNNHTKMYVTYTRIYGWSDYGGESSYQPGYRLENMMWMTLLVYDYIIPGDRMKNRNVQIPYELFFQLLQYFLMENYESEEIIRQGLERKLDTMVNRELYSKYKTAPIEEEREKSRQEYLDRRGIPENFRW